MLPTYPTHINKRKEKSIENDKERNKNSLQLFSECEHSVLYSIKCGTLCWEIFLFSSLIWHLIWWHLSQGWWKLQGGSFSEMMKNIEY